MEVEREGGRSSRWIRDQAAGGGGGAGLPRCRCRTPPRSRCPFRLAVAVADRLPARAWEVGREKGRNRRRESRGGTGTGLGE